VRERDGLVRDQQVGQRATARVVSGLLVAGVRGLAVGAGADRPAQDVGSTG
jgi:hypothetical protein